MNTRGLAMKIGLALSGGGALGAAHIGILEELEKNDISIDGVCGTSCGAIVGLLFCEGGAAAMRAFLADYARLNITSKVRGLLINPPHRLFSSIEDLLSKYVSSKDIRLMRPKFSCVATDIGNGEMVVLDEGNPIRAAMASAAYPGVFPVQRIGERHLIDGGLIRNLPADVVRAMGVDFVIGSSLYTVPPLGPEIQPPLNRVKLLIRSLEIMERALSSLQMINCDFCLIPPTESYKWYDFDRLEQIAELGRLYAAQHIDELLKNLTQHITKSRSSSSTGA